MKFFIAILALAALAHADVSHLAKDTASVLRQESEVVADGYKYAYETSNGIVAEESAQLKNANTDNAAYEVTGFNQFVAPNGEVYRTSYVANENGYQPQGEHLPTPPPTPVAIVRLLEYLRTHASQSA